MSTLVEAADGRVVATLDGELQDGHVTAAWTPGDPGTFRFTVTAAGATARSPELHVGSWIRLAFADDSGRPVKGLLWRLTDRDGTAIEGRTDRSGLAEWEGHAPGSVRLDLLSLARTDTQEDADIPSADHHAAALAVGGHIELEDRTTHSLRVDRGLVLGLRIARSDLHDAPLAVVIVAASGAELARRALAEAAVPQGDHVRLAFPGTPATEPVTAYLEHGGGRRVAFFVTQAAPHLDVRHAPQPAGEITEGETPETQPSDDPSTEPSLEGAE